MDGMHALFACGLYLSGSALAVANGPQATSHTTSHAFRRDQTSGTLPGTYRQSGCLPGRPAQSGSKAAMPEATPVKRTRTRSLATLPHKQPGQQASRKTWSPALTGRSSGTEPPGRAWSVQQRALLSITSQSTPLRSSRRTGRSQRPQRSGWPRTVLILRTRRRRRGGPGRRTTGMQRRQRSEGRPAQGAAPREAAARFSMLQAAGSGSAPLDGGGGAYGGSHRRSSVLAGGVEHMVRT
jgi:hypothetical protein